MKNMPIFLMLLFFIGCSTDELESQSRGGFGELIRDGYPNEINPFVILKETVDYKFQPLEEPPTILKEDVDDYYPLRLFGSPYAYVFSIKVSAEHYIPSYIEKGKGVYIFLAQKEMPSHTWYNVLKVCTGNSKAWRLEGVVL
jgi:hypothetical protein